MVVEIKMKHLIIGLLSGLVLFLSPGLITGNGGLLGSELFSGLLSWGIFGVILLGTLYAVISGVIYSFILKRKMLPQIKKNSIKFSGGILLAYLVFWIVGLSAFSNFGF